MTDKECRDIERSMNRTPKKKKQPVQNVEEILKSISQNQANNNNTNNSSINDDNSARDAAYSEMSLIFGRINRMRIDEMRQCCQELKLDDLGSQEAVKRRLKEHFKELKYIEHGLVQPSRNKNVDFFLVIDFEATCEEKNPLGYPHEIIEFPAVLVDSLEKKVVDIFHEYVRPTINPKLSDFCKTLTGIGQDTVDKADSFDEVYKRFEKWLKEKHKLSVNKTFVIVTDGPFDMAKFLYLQTKHCNLTYPDYAKYWANIRKVFSNFYKSGFYARPSQVKLPGLQTMLSSVGLEFEGQPHSGLDDSKNIARVLIKLISDKALVRVNERLVNIDEKILPDHAKLKTATTVSKKDAESWQKKQKESVMKD